MQKLKLQPNKLSSFRAFELSSYFERERGFSLVETVVYVGLLAIIVSVSIYFMLNIFSAFNKNFAQKAVMANSQHALDAMTEEIKFAKSIYTPTSVFSNDNGQLSIETIQNPPANESATFTDFYLDNGRIYVKREGQTEISLTSNQVKINKLKFTYLNPANAPEGVQVFLESQYNTTSALLKDQTIANFTTSAIIRYR